MTVEHWCDRCAEAPAVFLRETLAVCETCAHTLDARARVQATWQATTTFARILRAWEAR